MWMFIISFLLRYTESSRTRFPFDIFPSRVDIWSFGVFSLRLKSTISFWTTFPELGQHIVVSGKLMLIRSWYESNPIKFWCVLTLCLNLDLHLNSLKGGIIFIEPESQNVTLCVRHRTMNPLDTTYATWIVFNRSWNYVFYGKYLGVCDGISSKEIWRRKRDVCFYAFRLTDRSIDRGLRCFSLGYEPFAFINCWSENGFLPLGKLTG